MSAARPLRALCLLALLHAAPRALAQTPQAAQAPQDDTSWSLRPGAQPADGATPPRVAPPPAAAAPEARPAPRERRRWACPPMSLGFLTHLGLGGTTAAAGPRYLILEARAGLLCVRNSDGNDRREGLRLVPELAYHYLRPRPEDEQPAASVHLGSLGLGVGYGNRWLSVGGVGRLLAGTEEGGLALGLRHGLLLRGLYDSVAIEASHLALHLPGGWRNELYGGISVNVLLLALIFVRR